MDAGEAGECINLANWEDRHHVVQSKVRCHHPSRYALQRVVLPQLHSRHVTRCPT
jgi:hypothetical protein